MSECAAEGCQEYAPGYDAFCHLHSPPDWRCECRCLNRWDSVFCYLCGACAPEDDDDDLPAPGRTA